MHYRRGSKSSFTMNQPPAPAQAADPRGHFCRVCFDSKFPVKLVTRTGSLSDPANSHRHRIFSSSRFACEFSASFDARFFLGDSGLTRKKGVPSSARSQAQFENCPLQTNGTFVEFHSIQYTFSQLVKKKIHICKNIFVPLIYKHCCIAYVRGDARGKTV